MFLGSVPAEQLWKTIIDTRETLAAIRNAHNIYDPFVVPPGLIRTSDGPNGGSTGNVLASQITAEICGLPSSDIHAVKRANWMDAVSRMNQSIAALQSPTGITSDVAPTIPVIATSDTNSPVITGTSDPAISTTGVSTSASVLSNSTGISPVLMLAGGVGLFFLLNKKGGKRKRR
jgi:hypothetical protein